MSKLIDLAGSQFGRLRVVRRNGSDASGRARWDCVCEPEFGGCGREHSATCDSLKSGRVNSCGCLRAELTRARSTKHTHARQSRSSPEYMAWVAMRGRCHCPTNRWFARYGARGVIVCERWRESFEAFLADMGVRPSSSHSLDRVNNDGNYEPGNVRWATKAEQNGNRGDSRLLEIDGKRQCMAAWARQYGMSDNCVRRRLNRGWDIHRALTTPVRRAWPTAEVSR